MINETAYAHIERDEANVPFIAGTTTKVVELALDKIAYGWGAEELYLQHPHLTLGQIYSALAYYWDHQEELDADIQRRLADMEQLRKTTEPTPLLTRLKAQGLIS